MLELLYENDWGILESSIRQLARDGKGSPPLSFCEVGCAEGCTSGKILRLLDQECQLPWTYYAVDCEALGVSPPQIARAQFVYVRGLSFDTGTLAQIPDDLVWVFIDACHCAYCVERDALAYIPKLRRGGIIAFHDASPRMQGQDPQAYDMIRGFHDHDTAVRYGIQVRKALNRLDCASLRIELLSAAPDQVRGGVELYRKL